jgi:hypothetical protein
MSDINTELVESTASLEASARAAMTTLELEAGQFGWFTGEVQHPMPPQKVLVGQENELDHLVSTASLYGGRMARELGVFAFGHIQAQIREPLSEGVKHQSNRSTLPVPFVTRDLDAKDGHIIVATPTLHPGPKDGPVVTSGHGGWLSYQATTTYNTQTGDVTIRSGRHMWSGFDPEQDQTVEQNAFKLPDTILVPRLIAMVRTIKAAAAIFMSIACGESDEVTWKIQR